MPEAAPILLAVAGTVLLIAFCVALVRHARRELQGVETAWRALAEGRGFEFVPHTGWFWWNHTMGTSPCLRGWVDSVAFVVELTTTYRVVDSTRVVAPLAAMPPTFEPMALIPAESLEVLAPRSWPYLSQRHGNARWLTWADGPALAIGWRGLERDPVVIEAAIAVAVALGRQPPGAGSGTLNQPARS